MDKVDVYILNTALVKDNYDFILPFVSEDRREKALRFVQEKDRLLSLGAGYLLKKHLPKGKILENSSGKPYLEGGPFFNISHSGVYAVLAISKDRDVGVDIERIKDDKLAAIKFVLNDEEKNIEDTNSLFRMWSNKESLIKCLSTSLKDIKMIDGLPLEGIRTFTCRSFFTKSMIYDNYSLSVTLLGKDPFNIYINLVDKL